MPCAAVTSESAKEESDLLPLILYCYVSSLMLCVFIFICCYVFSSCTVNFQVVILRIAV